MATIYKELRFMCTQSRLIRTRHTRSSNNKFSLPHLDTAEICTWQYFRATDSSDWLHKVKQVFAISKQRLEENKISLRIVFFSSNSLFIRTTMITPLFNMCYCVCNSCYGVASAIACAIRALGLRHLACAIRDQPKNRGHENIRTQSIYIQRVILTENQYKIT